MPRVIKKKRATRRKKKEQDKPRLGFGARLSLLVLGTITLLVLLSWVWHSRWPHTVATSLFVSSVEATKKVGFSVSDVSVTGRHYTSRDALFKALNIKRSGSPIFLFDPNDAHKNIMALPWTAKVTVVRSLPNKILINLIERKPIARWQYNKRTIVIDSQGKELTAAKPKLFASLPLIVGNADPKQIRQLLTTLQRYPTITHILKAAVRVGKRRWDFHLHPKILIKLPEHNIQKALNRLTRLIQNEKVLERGLKSIDMRLASRTILEPYKRAKLK